MKRSGVRIAVLAGGSGTRFWPVGRAGRPKQLLALDGDDPRCLLAATLARVVAVSPARPWIVVPKALAGSVRSAVRAVRPGDLVLEPSGRNTAAAVLLAAHVALHEAPDAALLVVPADHHAAPLPRYRAALAAMAARAANSDAIVTLGLRPTRPATGYGYLEVGARVGGTKALPVRRVLRYVEKPSLLRAKRMVAGGRHLWNGGTFAFRPEVLLAEARRVLPAVALPIETAFGAYGKRSFAAALARAYRKIPAISVDFGVMEKARAVEVVAADLDWDDLGSWDAVARHRTPDVRGNRVRGSATLVDARNCVVDAEAGHVALLGVEDVVVVSTKDAVLVARRGLGERVRDVVERLKAKGLKDLLT